MKFRSSRTLYELSEDGVHNKREVHITTEGDLVLDIYDLDPELESMIGDSDFEKQVKVPQSDVEKVRLLLGHEFGFVHTDDPDAEVLDVLVSAFGGSIDAVTKIIAWLDANQVPHTDWSY